MAPGFNTEHAIGVLEGKLEGIVATLTRVDERSAKRDEAWAAMQTQLTEMVNAIGALQKHATDQVVVTQEFNALQQTIRDAKMQARGFGKGVTIGLWLAAGAGGMLGGAAVTKLYNFIVGS